MKIRILQGRVVSGGKYVSDEDVVSDWADDACQKAIRAGWAVEVAETPPAATGTYQTQEPRISTRDPRPTRPGKEG